MKKMKMSGEKTWNGATPWSHSDPVMKSGSAMKHAGSRLRGERSPMPKATSMNMQPMTEPNMPSLAGKDMIPPRMESATPMGHYAPVPHSGPHHDHSPMKSWKKKGYASETPSSMPMGETRNGGSSLS